MSLYIKQLWLGLLNIKNQCISPLTLWVRIPVEWGVLDATLCDKVCQWLATGRWISPGTPVSSINKTDRHDIAEILLKVAIDIINQPLTATVFYNGDILRSVGGAVLDESYTIPSAETM